jgi:hypothetical protein
LVGARRPRVSSRATARIYQKLNVFKTPYAAFNPY